MSVIAATTEAATCGICHTHKPDGEPGLVHVAHSAHHIFHSSCLLSWLSTHNSCPTCHTPINVITHVYEEEITFSALPPSFANALFHTTSTISHAYIEVVVETLIIRGPRVTARPSRPNSFPNPICCAIL